ncbi:MAG: site-specific integrase [Verrucomicrobiota bacterium]
MPRIPHTIQRDGVYQFNVRYPTRLIKGGVVDKTHFKRSLGTKDWRVAKARVARELAKFQFEVERLERKLEASEEPNSIRPLSSLSREEQRDVIFEWFIAHERDSERFREEMRSSPDEVWRRERIIDAKEDLSTFEGGDAWEPVKWEKQAASVLEARGVEMTEGKEADDFIALFRRAVIEAYWRNVEAFDGRDFARRDPAFEDLHSESQRKVKAQASGHSIAEICERYPKRKGEGVLSGATILSYVQPIRVLEQLFSPSRDLQSLSFEDGEKVIEFLPRIPQNATKRYRDKTLQEAAVIEDASNAPKRIAPKTQRDIFITIKSILNHAVEIGWIDKNPFASTALIDRLPRIEKRNRATFSGDELTRIFQSPNFTKWRGAKDTQGFASEGRYWVPLLALYNGVRANEAASLLVEDVKEEDGIYFLLLRETDEDGNRVKRLKTPASARRVPLHQQLIDHGFLDFVGVRQIEGGDPFLFPELTPNEKTENRAKVLSQWFGNHVRSILGDAAKVHGKDLHSFRHFATDSLRRATDSDEKRWAILGWSEGGVKRNAGFDYGEGFSLEQLKQLVDLIDVPGFSLS